MKTNILNLIEANKTANSYVEQLKNEIDAYKIETGNKADFGNLCIALRGYEMVAEATECLLYNSNVIIDEDGDYYQKIDSSKSVKDGTEESSSSNS